MKIKNVDTKIGPLNSVKDEKGRISIYKQFE